MHSVVNVFLGSPWKISEQPFCTILFLLRISILFPLRKPLPSLIFILDIVGNKPKGRISNWVFQETKHAKFSEKQAFLAHLIRTCSYQVVRNVCFSGNLARCFIETPVLRFALLPYYRRHVLQQCDSERGIWYSGNRNRRDDNDKKHL